MTATASTPRASGWLYGPVPDLLLGCGLLYTLLFIAFALFGPSLRALQPAYVIPVLILLVSMPHYGGTLVRVYDQRRDRRSYALFSIWATLLIAALFVWGAFASVVASWLFTVYITWSPWHYTGQNYGLAVMFLRRRGVPLSTGVKRLLYASFLLAFLLTFLVFHSAISVIDYNARAAADASVVFLPLGIPPAVHQIVFPLAAAAYLATLVASAVLLLRHAPARDLVPAAALVLTQALWFAIPFGVALLRHCRPASSRSTSCATGSTTTSAGSRSDTRRSILGHLLLRARLGELARLPPLLRQGARERRRDLDASGALLRSRWCGAATSTRAGSCCWWLPSSTSTTSSWTARSGSCATRRSRAC